MGIRLQPQGLRRFFIVGDADLGLVPRLAAEDTIPVMLFYHAA
jgi:hypothetical protein